MTRKSKRELERHLEELEEDVDSGDGDIIVVEHGPGDGRRVLGGDPDDVSSEDTLIRITNTVVMGRERAEREDVEILGPAEDVPGDDAVRVNPNHDTEIET